jgi:membrane peptidoglycan carboxypeptidase
VKRLLGNPPADLILRTTIDLELQKLAEEAVNNRLEAEGARKNVSQAALVALAPDGAILAVVGGRDYDQSQFNRAVQARRQAGSLFKLFVYLTAFQKGYTPDSTLVDQPTKVGEWEPQNASGRFRGPVSLRTAFASSINTVAVQLADTVGIPAVIETAKRLGVQSELPAVPSLALGSAEVTLLEMTRAYAAVAAGLQTLEPYSIRSIGAREQPLYTRPAPNAAPDPNRAAMVDLLAAVVREGTGRAARLPQPVAGKTGTTQEYRDAWFVGFTSDIVVGVWVGNDDNAPMNNVSGGDLPATIWKDFVARASQTLARKRGPTVASRAGLPAAAVAAPPPGTKVSQEPDLRGAAAVLDTATIEVRGRPVRLFGVEGEGGRGARELARFLRGREVVCEPVVGGGDAHRCNVNGDDLSETILLNGAARATPEATPELVAAEDRARAERVGLWRRFR